MGVVAHLECEAWVYWAPKDGSPVAEARMSCLAALARDCLASFGRVELVIEEDNSMRKWDNQVLTIVKAELGEERDRLVWSHAKPSMRPLLSVPDIIGWCYQASDRNYFGRIQGMVKRREEVAAIESPVRVRKR